MTQHDYQSAKDAIQPFIDVERGQIRTMQLGGLVELFWPTLSAALDAAISAQRGPVDVEALKEQCSLHFNTPERLSFNRAFMCAVIDHLNSLGLLKGGQP